jgi:hypothetical protein
VYKFCPSRHIPWFVPYSYFVFRNGRLRLFLFYHICRYPVRCQREPGALLFLATSDLLFKPHGNP